MLVLDLSSSNAGGQILEAEPRQDAVASCAASIQTVVHTGGASVGCSVVPLQVECRLMCWRYQNSLLSMDRQALGSSEQGVLCWCRSIARCVLRPEKAATA